MPGKELLLFDISSTERVPGDAAGRVEIQSFAATVRYGARLVCKARTSSRCEMSEPSVLPLQSRNPGDYARRQNAKNRPQRSHDSETLRLTAFTRSQSCRPHGSRIRGG